MVEKHWNLSSKIRNLSTVWSDDDRGNPFFLCVYFVCFAAIFISSASNIPQSVMKM